MARIPARAPRVARVVRVLALLSAWLGVLVTTPGLMGQAWAAPTRKVSIDSQPRGASIYLGEKEAGAAGVTPLVLDLPVGETVVIIELENHIPKFETITVPKGKGKAVKVTVQLEPSAGAIVVASDAPVKGARILVDGEDEGPAPGRVEVPAGSHRVEVVTKSGKSLHNEEVQVEPGAEVSIQLASGKPEKGDKGEKGDKPDKGDKGDKGRRDKVATGGGAAGDGAGGGKAGKGKPGKGDKGRDRDDPEPVAGTALDGDERPPVRVASRPDSDEEPEAKREPADGNPPAARTPDAVRVRFAPLVELGWRYFEYSGVDSIENTPALKQKGTVLIGARAEVVPLGMLKNLAVQVVGGYAVPQDLASSQGMLRAALWRVDVAATYRFGITSHASIVALGGYSRARYRFEGPSAAVALVPDAAYSQVRLGVGLLGRLDWLELLALVENRPVLAGGVFADRFKTASADGLAGQLSAMAFAGPRFFARVDGGVSKYGWSFTYEQGDTYRASGASDLMLAVSFSAGAAF